MAAGGITTVPIGSVIPLCYGPVRATGKKLLDYTAADTTIIQAYGLAAGEWDGCDAFFVNNQAYSLIDATANTFSNGAFNALPGSVAVHFHPGVDTPVGSPFTPASLGSPTNAININGDQLLDQMWSLIPNIVNPLFYTRLAYYFVSFKPLSTSTSPTLTPIGDWRTTRCRIFDADGNQTQYGYTLNPAWHFVDSWLRRVIKPEYAILPVVGADQLSSTEKACFDWESIAEAAAYYDGVLANGQKRFQGAYAFASSTTLGAIHEQILLCCRSYQQEYAGKISLMCDKPRASTFLLSSKHLVPNSITVDQQEAHSNPNRFISQFLDLELPIISNIATISRATVSGGPIQLTITTTETNPVAKYDTFIIVGVADDSFDGPCFVTNVSSSAVITANAYSGGPDASSTGGVIGYPQSRFASRTPELNHRQAQLAAGQLISSAAENATRSNKNKVQYDFASTTYDQQNRLLKYELIRSLGLDQVPWKPPFTVTLSAWSEAVDGSMRSLKAQLPGDVITLDDSVLFEFPGDYEVIERDLYFFNWQQAPDGSASTDQNAGTILLKLRTFNPDAFPDISDSPSASYATLPGDHLWEGSGPVNSSYQVAYDSITATDAGTSVTVAIVNLQARIGGGRPLSYTDTDITNLPYSTFGYLFVDDPAGVGGNLPIQWTTDITSLSYTLGRMFIADLTTPASGSASTSPSSGGGSGLPSPGGGSGSGGGGGGRTFSED